LLERLNELIHEYLNAPPGKRREMLETDIAVAKDRLRRIATSFGE